MLRLPIHRSQVLAIDLDFAQFHSDTFSLLSQTGWHYSTNKYHPSYPPSWTPPTHGRRPRRTTPAGSTSWEQTAHDLYWDSPHSRRKWSHDPRAEWTSGRYGSDGPTSGNPWLRKWVPWLVNARGEKGQVTRVLVYMVRRVSSLFLVWDGALACVAGWQGA